MKQLYDMQTTDVSSYILQLWWWAVFSSLGGFGAFPRLGMFFKASVMTSMVLFYFTALSVTNDNEIVSYFDQQYKK